MKVNNQCENCEDSQKHFWVYTLSKDVHNDDDKSVAQCFCEIFLLEASNYTKFLMWSVENQLLIGHKT